MGASTATWYPFSMAITAASAATKSCRSLRRLAEGGSWGARPACLGRFPSSTRFCAPVGLKGSIALILSRTPSFNWKEIPGCSRALERFSDSPHSSQKNSSKISRHCAGVRNAFEQAEVGAWLREMQRSNRGPPARQFIDAPARVRA